VRKVTSVFITVLDDSVDPWKLGLICGDDQEDYFITTGFDTVSECWDYARCLAKGFGLSEENIDAGVQESPRLTRIK
jgi:hypothetical protein